MPRYLHARHIAPRFLKYDVIALYRYINSNSPSFTTYVVHYRPDWNYMGDYRVI